MSEWNCPCTRVNIGFLRRFVERVHEPLVLLVRKFGGTTGSRLVVDDVFERLLFEPFEAGEPLRGPTLRKSVEFGGGFLGEVIDLFVGDRRHQPLYRSTIIDLRQDLAEVFGRDVLQIRHTDTSDSNSMNF